MSSSSPSLTFYAIPYCPFCFRVRFVLHHHSVAFEEKLVHPVGKDVAPAWFLALNPLGQVPVIVHDGKPVVDSAVIAQYVDEKFGSTKLFPTEEKEKAAHEEAIKKVSGLMPAFMGFVTALGPAVPEAKEKFNSAFVQLFANDFHGPYFLGSSPSYADVMLYQISVYSEVLKVFKNWSLPDSDDHAKLAAKKFSDFFALLSNSPAGQKTKFADHGKFLESFERRARPGPISTMILTHNAFRNNMKSLLATAPSTSHSTEFSHAVSAFLDQFGHHAQLEDSLLLPAIDAKEHNPASKVLSQPPTDYQFQTKLLDVPKDGHKKLQDLELHVRNSLKENQSVQNVLDRLKAFGEVAQVHLSDEEKVMSPAANKWSWEQQAVIIRYAFYAYDNYSHHGSSAYLLYLLNHLNTPAERQQIIRNLKFSFHHAETHEGTDEERYTHLISEVKKHGNADIVQQIQTVI